MNPFLFLLEVRIPSSVFSSKTTEVIREAVVTEGPKLFGIGLDTVAGLAAGTALGGGGVGLAFAGFKLAKYLIQKRREGTTVQAPGQFPFPRRLDEALQLRQMAEFDERRVPEYDAAVGRIVAEELAVHLATGSKEETATLKDFWNGVRNRVDRLMPPSTIEYRKGN